MSPHSIFMFEFIKSLFNLYPEFGGVPRSSLWGKCRREHWSRNPTCAVCDTKKEIEVHHIQPYHLFPSKELDPHNLLSLCAAHHIFIGHLMSWHSYNKDVVADSKAWREKIRTRP